MSANPLQVLVILEAITCYKCGVTFGMDREQRAMRLNDGESFWCPNGHSQHYTESKIQKLEKQLKNIQKQKEWAENNAKHQADMRLAAERREAAQKGAKTKLKNRIANGVCPCCTRSFQNLSAHMKTKHPEFVKPA